MTNAGRRGWRRGIAWRSRSVLVVCASLGVLSAGPASAATYFVGKTEDSPPGSICDPTLSSNCTLRQIISFENETAPSSPDKVGVPAGVYRLTYGALIIETSVTIFGVARAMGVTIIKQASTTPDRVFDIQAPGASPPTVSIAELTVAGGTADASNELVGGDLRNAGHLTLTDDWITGGHASSGGGIANVSGSLIVDHSLVSDNHASSGSGDSGGIANLGKPSGPSGDAPAHLTVNTSTVSNNDARLGAGIFSQGDNTNETTITNSTIAYNRNQEEAAKPAGPGAGLLLGNGDGGTMTVQNTIVASNTAMLSGPTFTSSNCSAPAGGLGSLGFNLESGIDCGFVMTGDLPSTDPQFTVTEPTYEGGNTNVLPLSAASKAIDHIPPTAPGCTGSDQRRVIRPYGSGCEPGAYEFSPPSPPNLPGEGSPFPFIGPSFNPNELAAPPGRPAATTGATGVTSTTSATFSASITPNGLATTVHFEYGLDTNYGSITAEQPVASDFVSHAITARVTGLLPNSRYHVRAVASNSAGTVTGLDQVFQLPADLPPPPPVLGKNVNIQPVSGLVLVRLPSVTSPAKGQSFVPLTESRQVPLGTDVDVRAGTIRLVSAAVTRGKTFRGDFQGGVFRVLQMRSRRERGVTELRLLTGDFAGALSSTACVTVGRRQSFTPPPGPAAIARRHLSSRVLQRLQANVHGHFRTSGRYSAATARGTRWDTLDRCDGTLTRVQRGTVVVRDVHRQRSIVVQAGQSYLAMAPQ